MSEWVWVLAGYTLAYGAIGGYLVVLAVRWRRVRRDAGDD